MPSVHEAIPQQPRRSHCQCPPGGPHCHALTPEPELSHLRRIHLAASYPTDDPLRMLAVVVLSLAAADARRGQHVTLGPEWFKAADLEPTFAEFAGVVVLEPCVECGQLVDPEDPAPWHALGCPRRLSQVAA